MTRSRRSALVDTHWLAERIDDPSIRILDASWHLPPLGRNAKAEFVDAHIPGARFFDIDGIADRSSSLPHMLPSPEAFASAVSALGIGNQHTVVVYDTTGVYSAPRAWWTFRVFGHDEVFVLNGGLPKWRAEGRDVAAGDEPIEAAEFRASFRPELVRSIDQVRANLQSKEELVADARSRGRFDATAPEPRPGMRGGHMPNSVSLPFDELVSAGELLSKAELEAAFKKSGVDPDKKIVTSCGSGLTACILNLGLYELGQDQAAVYDGSWAEWGGREDTPIE